MTWTTPRTWVDGENPTAATMNEHIGDNAEHLFTRMQTGQVRITPVANVPTSVTETFGEVFDSVPVVVIAPSTGVPGTTVVGWGADSETTTSFRATVHRENTTDTTLNWIAVIP